jgi:perosamine synthetase
MSKIPYFVPNITKKDILNVTNVLKSKWISPGKILTKLEGSFAKTLGVSKAKCIGVSSGYAALFLAIRLLNLKKNDIVLMPNINFVASSNIVKFFKGKIVLVDAENKDNPNISIKDLEKKLSSKVKAVIICHYGGYPCDMQNIMRLKKKYNFALIEDACHAMFSKYNNKKYLGSFGDFAAFSFYANKNITSAEGGMLYCKKQIDANKSRILKNHGLNTDSFTHSINRYHKNYDVTEIGYNFRLDDVRSSLLINQINKIQTNNSKRHKIFLNYLKLLKLNNKIEVLFSDYKSNNYSRHLFVILAKNKKKIQNRLKLNGISFSCHYKPINQLKIHKNRKKYKHSSYLFDHMISLPIYPGLSYFQIQKICKIINSN